MKDFIVRNQKTTEVEKLIKGYNDTHGCAFQVPIFVSVLAKSHTAFVNIVFCCSVPSPVKEDLEFERYDVYQMT